MFKSHDEFDVHAGKTLYDEFLCFDGLRQVIIFVGSNAEQSKRKVETW